jgi:hypothetical protein
MNESAGTGVIQNVPGGRNIFTGSGDIHVFQQLPALDPDERQGLAILRDRVNQFWIEDVLKKSIHDVTLLELGKTVMVDAVEHPWAQVIALPDKTSSTLPPGTKISDVFHRRGNSLLILGDPGSGKTTTLLDLTRSLIIEAQADSERAVPVVFNLSTWSNKRPPISVWLAEELRLRYHIPRWQGEQWLKKGRLILLLDALDEVVVEGRAACVEAIKRYENPIPGLAVCSRLEEYTALPVRVNLNAAICLQPLSLKQVDAYLTSAGPRLASLRQTIVNDPELQALLQSPLMLSIICLASVNYPSNAVETTAANTQEERRAAVFDAYIESMFKRKARAAQLYSKQKTLVSLCWLARMMIDRSQTLFQLEQLQPSVLPSNKSRLLYCFASRLLAGSGFFLPIPDPVTSGLIITATVSDFLTLRSDALSRKVHRNVVLYSVLTYCGIGAALAILFGVAGIGILYGAAFAVCFGMGGGWRSATADIQPVENVTWSWRMGLIGFVVGTGASILSVLLLSGTLAAEHPFLGLPLMLRVLSVLIIGLVIGLPIGAAGLLLLGFRGRAVREKFGPNTGIRRSLVYSLLGAGAFGCLGALILWWIHGASKYEYVQNAYVQIWLGLVYIAGICSGGHAVIRHVTLRTILVCRGAMPVRYKRFLEYATGLIFLRRAGGAYIFIHRSLMEHFARRSI